MNINLTCERMKLDRTTNVTGESKVAKEQFLQVCHRGDDWWEIARVEVVVTEREIAELVLLHKSAQHLPGDRALWEDNGRDGQIINGSEID